MGLVVFLALGGAIGFSLRVLGIVR